jgi:hypothetical protein
MQPFPEEVKLSHTAILHNQLTEVQSRATLHALHIRNTIAIYSVACPCHYHCDDDDFGHDCTSALNCEIQLFYLAVQIVKQSAAASVQPLPTMSQARPMSTGD